jgi:hypothetical protein
LHEVSNAKCSQTLLGNTRHILFKTKLIKNHTGTDFQSFAKSYNQNLAFCENVCENETFHESIREIFRKIFRQYFLRKANKTFSRKYENENFSEKKF